MDPDPGDPFPCIHVSILKPNPNLILNPAVAPECRDIEPHPKNRGTSKTKEREAS